MMRHSGHHQGKEEHSQAQSDQKSGPNHAHVELVSNSRKANAEAPPREIASIQRGDPHGPPQPTVIRTDPVSQFSNPAGKTSLALAESKQNDCYRRLNRGVLQDSSATGGFNFVANLNCQPSIADAIKCWSVP
jgi:hypothetical protein